jgi:hypothetical protein
MNRSNPLYASDAVAGLEARFGLRVAAALNRRAEMGGHDISERLRFAREQALERARATRRATAQVAGGGSTIVGTSTSGAAVLGRHPSWWTGLASAVPLVMLVAGLVLIDEWHDQAQIAAAADVDAALLSDALPPDAYSDPGFVEFLQSAHE